MERTPSKTPFDLVGGNSAVGQIVDRFYDLLDQDKEFAALRELHAPDLTPMRRSLTGFLTAWLGGPQDWFAEHPGMCMMSAHRHVPVTAETARQWSGAMTRAIRDCIGDSNLGAKMAEALSTLATRMAPA